MDDLSTLWIGNFDATLSLTVQWIVKNGRFFLLIIAFQGDKTPATLSAFRFHLRQLCPSSSLIGRWVWTILSSFISIYWKFRLFPVSELSITIPIIGETRENTIFLEERQGLTQWRPSYQPTGAHHSPRSVSVWRSTNSSDSLLLIWKPTLCTHWSLTENTARQFWVVRHGGLWLVQRPPRRSTVTERGSIFTHWQLFGSLRLLKQGSVLSPTMQTTARMLISESGLVQEGHMMTTTRVESLQTEAILIMGSSSLKPWDTSWYSNRKKVHMHWVMNNIIITTFTYKNNSANQNMKAYINTY